MIGKIPLEREMAVRSSILPGKSHGQRSVASYSPKGHKESNTTEQLHTRARENTVLPNGQYQ